MIPPDPQNPAATDDATGSGQTDETVVTEADLVRMKKRRTEIRKWITNSWKFLTMKTRPGSNHVPETTLENVERLSVELISYDSQLPDDEKCQEYADKVGIIVGLLEEDQVSRMRYEIEKDRIKVEQKRMEIELKRLEAEEAKLAAEKEYDVELKRLQLEREKAQIETEKVKTESYSSKKPKSNSMRLDVKIPPFDGSPCRYRKFEELFEALVQNNPSYDDAAKFLYFIQLIGNLADKYAPNLSPTIANLDIVKGRLREHFENPARVREHVRRIFEKLPTVKHFSQTNMLHELIVAWEEGVLSLKKSGTSEDQINNTYVRLMTSHLPVAILEKCDFKPSWTTDDLFTTMKAFYKRQIELNEYAVETTHVQHREYKPRTHIGIMNPNQQSRSPPIRQPLNRSPPRRPRNTGGNSNEKCAICSGQHLTIYCNAFDVKKRREIAESKKLCDRCLHSDHNRLDCRSKYVCPCGQPHSRVLCGQSLNRRPINNNNEHPGLSPQQNSGQTFVKTIVESNSSMNTHTINNATNTGHPRDPNSLVSYYKTVVVQINGEHVRVLIDGGCGRSSILESCAQRLNLQEYAKQNLKIGGLGGDNVVTSTSLVMANLQSIVTSHQLGTILSVVPTFGQLHPAAIPSKLWNELNKFGMRVSDTPEYHQKPIEIILGLEYVGILWLNMERLVTEDIYVRESIFGWSAFGVTNKFNSKCKGDSTQMMSINCCSTNESKPIDCTPVSDLTIEEKVYLDNFVENKVKIEENKFVVQLPWLSPTNLGTNEKQAFDRFNRLVKSLREKERFDQYAAAMKEMLKFAEPIPAVPDSDKVYYLPHHAVIRLDKSTTVVRIVYDGSASEKGYSSLNDNLFKGVTSWDSLKIFTDFRFGEQTFIADVEKAFLQIKVDPKDRDALRFWWFNDEGQPAEYRFTSVPFGTSASPFLLYASMYKLFKWTSEHPEYPTIKNVASLIRDRFYVDDLIGALQAATPEQINTIRDATIEMFSAVGMNIRKWRTNIKEIDQQWSPNAPSTVSLLGYLYDVVADTISLNVDIPPQIHLSVITKRVFSSLLARIYDPMGFVSPYIIHLRLFLRKLWSHSLDWDEPVPDELRQEALITVKDAHLVNQFNVERNVLPPDGKEATLLVFCDASKSAIGAVAYSFVDNKVKFICAKSHLVHVPTSKKNVDDSKKDKDKDKERDSIAVLELKALVLASELVNYLNNLKKVTFKSDSMAPHSSQPFAKVVICSDSLLNLQRLVKHPNDQRTSISLRVDKIAKLAPGASYRHVVSKANPADISSRGCSMTELLNNQMWFNPSPPDEHTRFNDEIRTVIAIMTTTDSSSTSTCKCSKLATYSQAISCWRRIARVVQSSMPAERQAIPSLELGRILLIKHVQRQHFATEIDAILKNESVDSASVTKGYKLFLDEDGILRLFTRLKSGANLSVDQVKPIFLPKGCHVVELMIQHEHRRLGHPGADRTMFAIRDQFFVMGLRKYVRKLISQCIMCKRLRGQAGTVDFGMVPQFRYDFESTPFTNVGIDIFGPLKVAMKTPGKRYGVIFSCATTRAVHIELICNQTAESVFQALLNFMARRGVPHRIYTDNGPNLLAVKKQLIKFLKQISEFHPELNLNISWIQLTVASPWRGGFYERLIRTIKDTLIAITFGKTVDDATLATALYQIEARINSRPLFIHEGQAITPSHFSAKRPLMQIPPIGSRCYAVCDRPKLIHYYKAMQSHVNAVWSAWYSQYLLTLKSFHQNLYLPNQSDSLRVGDAVILKNTTPVNKWPFGIVEDVVKSEDGMIRTVHVRTHDNGKLTVKARDIRTLIPFECTKEIHEEEDAAQSVELQAPEPLTPGDALTGSLRE